MPYIIMSFHDITGMHLLFRIYCLTYSSTGKVSIIPLNSSILPRLPISFRHLWFSLDSKTITYGCCVCYLVSLT